MHLTPAGSDLLPMARQMMLSLSTSAEAAAARNGQGEGVVRVVATTASVNGLLVRALPAFNDHDPSVQVHLKEDEIDDGLLAIARGQADMVCARRVDVAPEGWQFHALVPDRFVVVCAPDHPLADRCTPEAAMANRKDRERMCIGVPTRRRTTRMVGCRTHTGSATRVSIMRRWSRNRCWLPFMPCHLKCGRTWPLV